MKSCLNCLYLLTVLGLTACGQPGPLYLPENPPPGIKVVREVDQPAPIPERDIDQAPPPINTAPTKPGEQKTKEDQPPTENLQ